MCIYVKNCVHTVVLEESDCFSEDRRLVPARGRTLIEVENFNEPFLLALRTVLRWWMGDGIEISLKGGNDSILSLGSDSILSNRAESISAMKRASLSSKESSLDLLLDVFLRTEEAFDRLGKMFGWAIILVFQNGCKFCDPRIVREMDARVINNILFTPSLIGPQVFNSWYEEINSLD